MPNQKKPHTHDVCPWWCAYTFDNSLRRWLHRPDTLLSRYVRSGMTVMDIGCGMGIFTIAMARLTGSQGRVIAADLQPQMLNVLMKRARNVLPPELSQVIHLHTCRPEAIGYSDLVDFALAFYMVHETPDPRRFLGEIIEFLKSGGLLYIAEPVFHVSKEQMIRTLKTAEEVGFEIVEHPHVHLSRTAVLRRPVLSATAEHTGSSGL